VIVGEHGEDPRPADREDPFDALRWFRAMVELEEGITAFQMMRALKPWSRALSAAGWIDFDAWFAAMSAPMVREAEEDEDERLSGIELHPVAYVSRDRREGERTASVSVAWRPLGRYARPRQVHGRTEEHCSVSFVDPRLIGHLPLSVCTTLQVQDMRAMRPWLERPVLAESLPGVYGRLVEHPTFFDAIVLGFLDDVSFHGLPEETAEVAEGLIRAVDGIRSGEDRLEEFLSLDVDAGEAEA